MRVTFYGVRGSVPAPGPDTARYGGNTSCVEVVLADGSVVALDAGTGMRLLGNRLVEEGRSAHVHLLLSHTHWDHILGLPFFAPLWSQENRLSVYPLASDVQEAFRRNIFDDIHFPVNHKNIPAKVELLKLTEQEWTVGSARVRRIALNHPGGAQGFRIQDEGGATLAYLTDNELGAPVPNGATLDELARFSENVDLLIHDAQYVPADMPRRRGWGHSLVSDVLRLGVAAEPKELALFHHDPDRTDDDLDAIGNEAVDYFRSESSATRVFVAKERLVVELTG